MEVPARQNYILGDFLLDPHKRLLTRNGEEIHLANRPLHVLVYLIDHRERLVSRTELLERFWDGCNVYDETLTKCVSAIRKALADDTENPRFIETRWAGGYRYIGPLSDAEETKSHIETEIDRIPQPPLVPLNNNRKLPRLVLIGLAAGLMLTLLTFAWFHSSSAGGDPQLIRSIAVLPMRNLTNDPANDLLCDGMTEAFIGTLARIRGLKVISFGSVLPFKAKAINPRTLRDQLGVAAVLEGGIQKSPASIRIDVQLVSSNDGRVVWASRHYERPASEIFVLQDEISRDLIRELRIELAGEPYPGQKYTEDVEAYREYLQGRYLSSKRTEASLLTAIQHFGKAIEKDPNYALALTGMADAYSLLAFVRSTQIPPSEAMLRAKAAAVKAVEMDDRLAEAHTSLAAVRKFDWDWRSAETEYKRAIDLNPGYALAHHWYALFLTVPGRLDQALMEIQKALELDPLSLIIRTDLAQILYLARRHDEAIAHLQKTLATDPAFVLAHYWLGKNYEQQRRYDPAIAEFQKMIQLEGPNPLSLSALGHVYGISGRSDLAHSMLQNLNALSKQMNVAAYDRAIIHMALDERDQAFAALNRSYEERTGLMSWLRVDPMFDPLRSDPRFHDLVRRIGFPQF